MSRQEYSREGSLEHKMGKQHFNSDLMSTLQSGAHRQLSHAQKSFSRRPEPVREPTLLAKRPYKQQVGGLSMVQKKLMAQNPTSRADKNSYLQQAIESI